MSLHYVETHYKPHQPLFAPKQLRKPVTRDSDDKAIAEAYTPYIGYFGTYSVDYAAMTITHHIEGAKMPNREGASAVRPFYFKEGDLVLDFKAPSGMRFYRRLTRIENF